MVGICLSQRKCCLELLHEFDNFAAKPVSSPLPENVVLNHKEGHDEWNFTGDKSIILVN